MHTHSDPFAGLDSDLNDTVASAKPTTSYRGKFSDAQAALRYSTAGRATITLQSKRTGARFTYRISHPKNRDTGEIDKSTLMVSVLNGQDNESSYKWFANIKGEGFSRLWIGRKNPKPGDLSNDAPSVVAFKWVWEKLLVGVLHEQLDVWHEEQCGRCGRKLTVPSSIESGFGPECISHVGAKR